MNSIATQARAGELRSGPARSPVRYLHFANALTYLAVLAALLSVLAAIETGNAAVAGFFFTLACLADAFDGPFARRFRRRPDELEFGKQLDSLADAVVFGLAPVVAGYLLLDSQGIAAKVLWLAVALFYLTCVITRLGCYNLNQSGGTAFVGLPTTVAGLFWSAHWLSAPGLTGGLLLMVICAAAMISPLPVPRLGVAGRMVLLMCAVALLLLHGINIRDTL